LSRRKLKKIIWVEKGVLSHIAEDSQGPFEKEVVSTVDP
jgi:hypothetical protein